MTPPAYVHGASAIPLLGETIGDNLKRTVARVGPHDALVAPAQGYRATYAELWDVTTALAKALLVNQLWLNSRAGLRTESRQANQGLLDHVFAGLAMHPAHHYRVHLWDTRETAHRVTDSAAVIGHAAPGIAHMWHMGGHIWARLDRHADAAWQQEASARVDHAHPALYLLPGRQHRQPAVHPHPPGVAVTVVQATAAGSAAREPGRHSPLALK